MKKIIGYQDTKIAITRWVCDNCGGELTEENRIYWNAEWEEWGDHFGEDFEVCSIKCLTEYLKEKLMKYYVLYLPPHDETGFIKLSGSQMKLLAEFITGEKYNG